MRNEYFPDASQRDDPSLLHELKTTNGEWRQARLPEMNPIRTFFLLDQKLTIQHADHPFLNVSPESLRGTSIFDWFGAENEDEIRDSIASECSDGGSIEFEFVHMRKEDQVPAYFCLCMRGLPEEQLLELEVRDITYYRKIEEWLAGRMAFEALVTRLSNYFINLHFAELDTGIEKALGEICRFAGLDRSFVVLFAEENTVSSIHYEWCADNVPSIFDNIQRVPVDSIPWLFDKLLNGRHVAVKYSDPLPPGSEVLEKMMHELGTRSFIHVPVFLREEVIGFIGFDSMSREREWPEVTVTLLQLVGEMIANVLQRKSMEQQLRNLNESLENRIKERTKELQKANNELETFAYSVSHDLRSPLRMIGNFAGLLQRSIKDQLDAKGEELFSFITGAVTQMDKLVNGLLNFYQAEKGELVLSRVDLSELVAEIVGVVRQEADGELLNWEISELPVFRGDRTLIRQVLMNLIQNAVKYTAPKPKRNIQVGLTEASQQEFTFYVRDNGVGFDMNFVENVFEVFKRLHSPKEFAGNGIGMATVRRIVNRHGGSIRAEGKVGEGACFYVTLPFGG